MFLNDLFNVFNCFVFVFKIFSIELTMSDADTNAILTAIGQTMGDTNDDTKLESTKAMFHALVLAQKCFSSEPERNAIMGMIAENCLCTNFSVKKAAFECCVQVATEHYDHLQPYMNKLGELTFGAIKKEEEDVALPALEFWSTVCDEEAYLKEMAEDAAYDFFCFPIACCSFHHQSEHLV